MIHPRAEARGAAARPAPGRRARVAAGLLAALALAACEAAQLVVGTGGARHDLRSGVYLYTAWSDHTRDVAWWGYFDLRVDLDGRFTGSYRLPRQCRDRVGFGADCAGRVDGRVYRDGTVRFGLDEGWLSHEGALVRRSEVTGRWWTRLLGAVDGGTFELLPD